MKKYQKNLILALVCFLIVMVLNFFLPRLLPGNPIAYFTGFSEEDMTPAQVAYYRQALHLDEPLFVQFGYYLRSLFDGTLGYSYKKEAPVSALIGQRLGYTLQITLPAVLLSTALGLCWKAGTAAEVIALSGGSIGEKLYHAKIYFETADLFAWTAAIVLISAAFEKLFLLLVDKIAERMGA